MSNSHSKPTQGVPLEPSVPNATKPAISATSMETIAPIATSMDSPAPTVTTEPSEASCNHLPTSGGNSVSS